VDPDLDWTLGHHVNTAGQQLLTDQPLCGVGMSLFFLKSMSHKILMDLKVDEQMVINN
jgi:hypothetical protein